MHSILKDNVTTSGTMSQPNYTKCTGNRIPFHISGSHDSSTFGLDKTLELGKSENWFLRFLANNKITGCIVKEIAYKWAVAQSKGYTEQLELGIRYFDLRTEKRNKDSLYYFVHGLYGPKVFDCMNEINEFLEKHPKEVVLLDFNHFYTMEDADHEAVVKTVLEIFGKKICPWHNDLPVRLSLADMWKNDWQVLMFYANDDMALKHEQLWPSSYMPSPWANTMDIKSLLQFLTKNYGEKRPSFEVCQGVITPQTVTVVKHLSGSIRKNCADKLNPRFTAWLKGKVRGSCVEGEAGGINICIMDFVETCGYIQQVLVLNTDSPV